MEEEKQQEEPVKEIADTGAAKEEGAETPAVDEKGVPYYNRTKEAERITQKLEDKIQSLEETVAQLQNSANPSAFVTTQPNPVQYTPQQPQQVDPQEEINQFTQNPQAYRQRIKNEARYEIQLDLADKFVYDQDPKNYNRNIQRVIQTIREKGYSTADPLKAVKNAINDLRVTEAPKQEKKVVEEKRTQKIKEHFTEPGSPKPGPKTNKVLDTKTQAMKTGKINDVQQYLREAGFGS